MKCKYIKVIVVREPGWPSQLSIQLLISAQVMISQFLGLSPLSGSALSAQGLLEIFSLPLSLHTEHGVWHRAWSHDPKVMTWDEIKSWMLSRLSHPGTPWLLILKIQFSFFLINITIIWSWDVDQMTQLLFYTEQAQLPLTEPNTKEYRDLRLFISNTIHHV